MTVLKEHRMSSIRISGTETTAADECPETSNENNHRLADHNKMRNFVAA